MSALHRTAGACAAHAADLVQSLCFGAQAGEKDASKPGRRNEAGGLDSQVVKVVCSDQKATDMMPAVESQPSRDLSRPEYNPRRTIGATSSAVALKGVVASCDAVGVVQAKRTDDASERAFGGCLHGVGCRYVVLMVVRLRNRSIHVDDRSELKAENSRLPHLARSVKFGRSPLLLRSQRAGHLSGVID